MESEKEIIEANLKCPICLNIVQNPWETSCCGHLFCERCMKSITGSHCPLCRDNKFKFRKNIFASKLLEELDTKCPYGCNKMIKYSNIKLHKYECENSQFKCSIDNCKFEGRKDESLKHLIEAHGDLLAIISEKYSNLKFVYDKFDIFGKIEQNNLEDAKGERDSENIKTN
ncbi:MAG: hypothetical protein MJ252_03400 [archaeon]|nr:hypothetical protein [archaeon]